MINEDLIRKVTGIVDDYVATHAGKDAYAVESPDVQVIIIMMALVGALASHRVDFIAGVHGYTRIASLCEFQKMYEEAVSESLPKN